MNDDIVDSSFLDDAKAAFGKLLNRGFLKIRSSAYDDQAFGNAEVVLEASSFLVRLVRDRGDEFADVCSLSTQAEWRPLERTLQAVGAVGEREEGLLSAKEAALLVAENFIELEAGLSAGGLALTQRNLEILDSDASKRMKERWTGGADT